MSWSASTKGRVMKQDADTAIDEISYEHAEITGEMMDQIQAARRAAKELVKSVPGPYVTVNLSGHANGVGWHKKEGWASDCITVSVTQMHE